MQSLPFRRIIAAILNAWLRVRIHFDAFCLAPLAYLVATRWWFQRKRVRAKGQFAVLLSRSPRAYKLWGLHRGRAEREASPQCPHFPIIVLVQTRHGRGPDDFDLRATLESLARESLQVFVIDNPESDLVSVSERIAWDAKPWLMPLAAGDLLAPGAAAAYRMVITGNKLQAIYADDDCIDRWGRFSNPHFKPDWNPELFGHFDFMTGACIVAAQKSDLIAVAQCAGWAQSLVSRCASQGEVSHLPELLHHRHVRPLAPLAAKPLQPLAEPPPVSIIVPTRNRVELLRTCLEGIAATDYPGIEVIVVDNGSDDPETLAYLQSTEARGGIVLRHPGPFNYSTINNRAAAVATGKLLCLLNNDIEVIEPNWLATMAAQAVRDEVGAVGAQLLYPDGRIQHAGVVIGVGNAAGHAHRYLRPAETGYFRRHALPQFISAVTGACLVVQKSRFDAVGGLDERNFAVAFNDVDLCLRLNERGWQSFYEPRAVLIHHESVSRGFDRDPVGAARFAAELAALQRIWHTDRIVDPYHHPFLNRATEHFSVAI